MYLYVLSHQEDRSERLFETSLAAELVRSLLAANYANVLVDFLIAELPVLQSLCDQRCVEWSWCLLTKKNLSLLRCHIAFRDYSMLLSCCDTI
jgi:hypothetical protein